MTNRELAESYALLNTTGHTGNMFIDGQTIYSYGYHFPIATRLACGWYLINSERYSNTTARHISHVRMALIGSNIIESPMFGSPAKLAIDFDYLHSKYEEAMSKKARARSEGMKNVWNNTAREYARMIKLANSYQ